MATNAAPGWAGADPPEKDEGLDAANIEALRGQTNQHPNSPAPHAAGARPAPMQAAGPVEVKLTRQQLERLVRDVRTGVVEKLVREVRAPGAIALSVTHAATAVNCAPSTLREAIERHELPAFSMGATGDLRIRVTDLEAWVFACPAMDPAQVALRKARRHGRGKASEAGEVPS